MTPRTFATICFFVYSISVLATYDPLQHAMQTRGDFTDYVIMACGLISCCASFVVTFNFAKWVLKIQESYGIHI